MSNSRFKRFWVLVLVETLFLQTTFGAIAPSASLGRASFGIAHVGNLEGDAERAYPVIERKIRHWIESLDGIEATAQPIKQTLDREQLFVETHRNYFEKVIQGVRLGVERLVLPDDFEVNLSELRRVLRLPKYQELAGGARQQALLVLAAGQWRSGEVTEAEVTIREATLYHPDGVIEWDGEVGAEPSPLSSFEAAIQHSRSSLRRECLLNVNVEPHRLGRSAEVSLNGFDFKLRRQFRLANGADYSVWAVGPQTKANQITIRCERPGIKKVTLHLAPLRMGDFALLNPLKEGKGFQSLWLLEPVGDSFRMYLYTPGIGMDEIPVTRPLKVAELLNNPSDNTLPVATDAFMELVEKHRNSSLAYSD